MITLKNVDFLCIKNIFGVELILFRIKPRWRVEAAQETLDESTTLAAPDLRRRIMRGDFPTPSHHSTRPYTV